jgi:hypothetical protein
LLIFQVRQEFRGHSNQAEQIGLNFREHGRVVDGLSGREIVSPLHAGIIENAVEGREFFDDLPRRVPHRGGIGYVQNEMPHSGICGADASQTIFAAAADQDLISQPVKSFGETLSDARSAAGDKNRIRLHFHENPSYNL